jgi:hypothetical protein
VSNSLNTEIPWVGGKRRTGRPGPSGSRAARPLSSTLEAVAHAICPLREVEHPSSYIADFDSAIGMVRALAAYPHAADFPLLGALPRWRALDMKLLSSAVNRMPRRIQQKVYIAGGRMALAEVKDGNRPVTSCAISSKRRKAASSQDLEESRYCRGVLARAGFVGLQCASGCPA